MKEVRDTKLETTAAALPQPLDDDDLELVIVYLLVRLI